VIRRLLAIAFLPVVAAGAAAVARPATPPPAAGTAFGVHVVVPGQSGASMGDVAAPPNASGGGDGLAYPADGSAVRTGAAATSVAVQPGAAPGSQAVTDVLSISLFNGEITADAAAGRANAGASGTSAVASTGGSSVRNLVVLGQAVTASPNARVQLGDWGFAVTLEGTTEQGSAADVWSGRATVAGLHVTLTAAHGGLPAGSEITIGYAEATASAAVAAPPAQTTTTTTAKRPPTKQAPRSTKRKKVAKALPRPPEPKPGVPSPPVYRSAPSGILPELSPGGYVFPVYGPAGFSNTFGAPRADTVWHHGEDIFAPLGTPILAVADGTVFSVGWQPVGGYRLWLRDRLGNQFYYAHLSAYSPLALNGTEVRAGAVLGFMGNTGDAEGTPVHLHFEIHPVSMLNLGYDGAVAPYPYLVAWQRLQDVSFALGGGWAPLVPLGANVPRPGAILLGSSDIGSASGLDPASLERALVAPVSSEGDGALLRTG
jgi:murein DD-endopeptidase MepM/ murein hydrolase activator NlpD